MADPTTIKATTNTKRNSCVDVKCDCNTMWSLAQQFSTVRLCDNTGPLKGKFIIDSSTRARRIAATYARFYLELEDGGDLDKKGRFYWMALGAFASKTVACTFEAIQVRAMNVLSKNVWRGLGRGNLWLFCDISGWHWYYSNHRDSFDSCLDSRNTDNYVDAVKKQMEQLPWKDKSLPIIKNLAVSKEIKEGFALVKKFEAETQEKKRPPIQLAHLLAIANHEQGVILQPLIYDDHDFSKWISVQRSIFVNWATPTVQLVFTNACDTDKPELKSLAPEGTVLEDFKSRMTWIADAAATFHNLMQRSHDFMEGELRTIASWVDLPERVFKESYMHARSF
ncbi:hypothetical protein AAKU55_003292 [Oxalobacteraceae bacterium GrIS 1.11]